MEKKDGEKVSAVKMDGVVEEKTQAELAEENSMMIKGAAEATEVLNLPMISQCTYSDMSL